MTDSKIQRERWRILPKWPRYAVSNLGRVKRLAEREGAADLVLTPYQASSHGVAVRLRMPDGTTWKPMIRRLVALAWLPGEEKRWVLHKNGDYTDCRACNLAWSDTPPWWFGRPGSKVRAVSPQTGETVGVFKSHADGARACGVSKGSDIAEAVRTGEPAGGVLWTKDGEEDPGQNGSDA